MSLVLGLIAAGPAHAVSVCKQGPPTCQETTIAGALNDTQYNGQTVTVGPGIYSESDLWVGNTGQGGPRTVISESPSSPSATVIDGGGANVPVFSRFYGGTLRGFTIRGGNGGINGYGGDIVLQDLIIEDNNKDSGPGGGVQGPSTSASVTIIDCVIRRNRAPGGGGGIYAVGPLTITGSTIEGNEAYGDAGGRANGGGIHVRSFSTLAIQNTTITGNSCTGSLGNTGAGIWTPRTTALINVTISNNIAYPGTGWGEGGGIMKSKPTGSGAYLYIYGSTISGNQAEVGGGLSIGNTSRLVAGGTAFSGNIASNGAVGDGGGIRCGGVNSVESLNGTVSGNAPDQLAGCSVNITPPVGTTRTREDGKQGGDTNDPVSTFTGELFNDYEPDINLGGPMPLYFSRYYSSGFKQVGVFGNLGDGWRHSFDWSLSIVDTTMNVIDHKGRTIQFAHNGATWDLVGKTDVAYQMVEDAGVYALFNPLNQRTYEFSSDGLLIGVSDSRGNRHTLLYTGGPLSEVSDGLGRVLNFTYDGAFNLISVDDGLGRMVDFAYTGTYLTGVTDLTGESTVYNYSTANSNLTGWGLFTTMVRPEGNTPYEHRYWFADRRSSSELDSNGHQTIFRYVSATQTTIEDPLGNIRTHTHTATGELSASQDNAGLSVAISSDASGRRNSITDRLGGVTTMTYHALSGHLASRTNADGTTSSFTYAARAVGNNTAYDLTGITHADGTTESFTYDTAGNVIEHTDQAGYVTTITRDATGQPLTVTNALGGVSARTYTAEARPATDTDPAGNATTFTYDAFSRPSLVTNADSTSVSFTYDAADRLLSATNENGNTVTLTYDLNGNLATAADALLNTVTFAYDGNDRILSITDPRSGLSSWTYDELGRRATFTDPLLNVTGFGYDVEGRLTSVTDPLLNVWATAYDSEGIVASATDPLSNVTSFTSDSMGRITDITSPLGNVTSVSYDAMGRIATTTDALANVTAFSRDARGLLTGISLPGGTISTNYVRNASGQVTTITDANGNDWLRNYDASGRLISTTDPLAQTQTITYDNRNRPSAVTYPAALGSATTTYDGVGNPTGHSYSDGASKSFTFDANNFLTAATGMTRAYDANGMISSSNGITVVRDANNRITSMTLAPGKVVTYAYDANSRLTSVTDWAAGITTFTYDDAGRLTGIVRPNNIDTTNTWDSDGRLTDISETGVASIALTRDAKGQITAATRSVPLADSALALATTGNAYDAASQIVGATYDAAGRLTAFGSDTFTWNLAGQLLSYSVAGAAVSATYDALDRRLSRTVGATTRSYVWNDALALSSVSVEQEGGTDLRYYIHTPDGALLYRMDASSDARGFYHYDEMGNTQFVSDDAGAVIGSYAYTPYGELTASSGGLDNPFTWQGRHGVMDEGNGLYYMRARYYDSLTGRFISRDPATSINPRSVNPYQYASANPMRFIDPAGLKETLEDIRNRGFRKVGAAAVDAVASYGDWTPVNVSEKRLKTDEELAMDLVKKGVESGYKYGAKKAVKKAGPVGKIITMLETAGKSFIAVWEHAIETDAYLDRARACVAKDKRAKDAENEARNVLARADIDSLSTMSPGARTILREIAEDKFREWFYNSDSDYRRFLREAVLGDLMPGEDGYGGVSEVEPRSRREAATEPTLGKKRKESCND